jgi:hypothetical protein
MGCDRCGVGRSDCNRDVERFAARGNDEIDEAIGRDDMRQRVGVAKPLDS